MSWPQALPAAAFLLLALLAPGYLVLRALGLARLQSLAGAPAVFAAATGVLTVVYHWGGVPWTTLTATLGVLALVVLCLTGAALARAETRRRHGRRLPAGLTGWRRLRARLSPPAQGPRPWWPLGVVLTATALLSGSAAVAGIGPVDQPMQASDGVWHLNAVAYVRELADAYPVGALAPMYWGEVHYYPTGWHALAASIPAPVQVAAHLTLLVGLALVWPLGCASLLSALFSARSRRVRDGLPLLAGTFASVVATGPFVLMSTLWPYAWAVCLLPGTVALVMVARPRRGARRAAASRAGGWTAAGTGCLGLVTVHGTSVFNLAVIGLPAVLLVGLGVVRRRWRRDGRQRTVILALLAVAVLALVVGVIGFGDQLSMLASYTRPRSDLRVVWRQIVHDSAMVSVIRDGAWGGTSLSLVAVLGAVVAVARRRHRWAVLTAAGSILLILASANGRWSVLASPWYVQRARIQPLLEIAVLVLAATALEGLMDLVNRYQDPDSCVRWPWRPRRDGAPAGRLVRALAAVLVMASVAGMGSAAVARSAFHHYVVGFSYQPLTSRWPVMLSRLEVYFIRSSAERLPEDAVILGQPTNGSAYYWSMTGHDVVYPTLRRYDEPDRLYVAEHTSEILTDPGVCAALGRLGAHYYYTDDDPSEGGSRGGGETPRWRNQLDELPREALTPLASDGAHTLWLISGCGWTS